MTPFSDSYDDERDELERSDTLDDGHDPEARIFAALLGYGGDDE